MALDIPSITELQQRIANDLIISVNSGQTNLTKQIDPNIRNSFMKGLVDSMAAGFDENNDVLEQVLKQIFPQTATDIYLDRWGSWFGITRKAAAYASGFVTFTGTASTSIPASTQIQNSLGINYETNSASTILAQTLSVSSITRSGSTATVTTSGDHGLATNSSVTIAGAVETEYNGTYTISVTATNKFTYTLSGTPSSPATGTITAASTFAYIEVTATDLGEDGNLSNGGTLTLVSPIAGANNTLYATYDGLSGGLDAESDEDYRARVLERTSNLSAPFSEAGLPSFIKEQVPGVTRVWVDTATPSAGYVTIYFVRDNDASIIPSASQVTAVKNSIIDPSTGIKPANTPDAYVIVSAPTPISVDFTFSSLSPNTSTMQDAITQSLTDFFKSSSVNVGEDITLDRLKNVIYSTVDANGQQPTFALSAPAADVTISSGELGILGTITY